MKRVVVLFLLVFFFFPVVFAQTNISEVDKAYQCIEKKVGTDCSKLTYEEQAFVLLSSGDIEDCSLEFKKNSEERDNQQCWPKGSCRLKDTAIALLALSNIGEDTKEIENWLLNQTKIASSLNWFIEIDADKETRCEITYDNIKNMVTINEDKTIQSGAGNCLPVSDNKYWLSINSNCLEKEFKISCDEDFKSTLLYKTQNSPTIHVSQNLHQSVKNGETIEKITFKCFQQGTSCNYEGSLWASLALSKKSINVGNYIPYLEAFLSENRGFFPESFLFILTGDNVYLTSVIQDNFKGNYWQVGTYNKEYNSALAFLSLGDFLIPEVSKSKDYFLKNQGGDGCWNNVRDTGFLLYAGWPKTPARNVTPPSPTLCRTDADCGLGKTCRPDGTCSSPGITLLDCESSGFFCQTSNDCSLVGGTVKEGYRCFGVNVCCSSKKQVQSCVSQGGVICRQNEQCPLSANIYQSSDLGICCSTLCEPEAPVVIPKNLCQDNGGSCRTNCFSEEEEKDFLCEEFSGQKCCFQKKKSSLFWIWFFLALILVVIVLILLRNKIKLLIFRIKSKFRKSPVERTRPSGGGFPPLQGQVQPPRPFRPMPPPSRIPSQQPIKTKDKEFEETLKKLREMSEK
ncbi:MAG: hypothetical protein QW727_02570 [Candidatus Pacearchaeota archaeon]